MEACHFAGADNGCLSSAFDPHNQLAALHGLFHVPVSAWSGYFVSRYQEEDVVEDTR